MSFMQKYMNKKKKNFHIAMYKAKTLEDLLSVPPAVCSYIYAVLHCAGGYVHLFKFYLLQRARNTALCGA